MGGAAPRPYSTGAGTWSESQDSLFTARPSLTVRTSAAWSPPSLRYDPSTVQSALSALLRMPQRDTDAHRYDVVTLARQALTNRSRALLPQIQEAYGAKDLARFRTLTARWKSDMALLDSLLATDSRYLLGPWLAAAKPWGMEFDARSIITTWGHRSGSDAGGLHDYAARELAGLTADFHLMRWTKYFDSLDTALSTGTAPASIDWFAVEDAWNRSTKAYPLQPAGDPYAVATKVRDSLPAVPVGAVTGVGGMCLDITAGNSSDGTQVQLYSCNGTPAQTWSFYDDTAVRALNKCLDIRNGGVTAGTPVQIWECNDSAAQKWRAHPDGTLRNPTSGMCLDAEGGSSAAGTRLLIWHCHGGPNQRWTTPR
ncbi:alpha-N-acetylglucosaminidase C-terminal domain-containing protein [Actinokineospora soli]|uniref:Alpha-N-acetylglucosaminidase C-terminal domain-containing protein n=1 Tax=Actinokineospora soli TaxID=1048753 RepID=A0ABW2TKU1_9PSEU